MFDIPDKTTAWILKACGKLAVAAVVALVGYQWAFGNGVESMQAPLDAERAAHQADLALHAQQMRQHAERAARVADLARAAQTTYIEGRAAANLKHEQELADAIAKKDRLIAGYRAGAVQLQPWWECPSVLPAAGGVLGTGLAGTGPEVDGAAAVRAASLAEGVQDGASADAWIRRLQAEVTLTRAACAVPPGLVE